MAAKKKPTATTAENEAQPANVIDSKSATRGTKSKTKTVAAVAPVADGVIGSSVKTVTIKENAEPIIKPEHEVEKVAIFSTKNVHWDGVGSVKRGYNILPKSIAEKWLSTRSSHTRLATPEEVAKEFGA
jgi:hypothetical protein